MAWGEDFETFNDAALEMAKSFTLPSKARLQFNHGYAFETDFGTAYDGGVIEVSENGGATWRDVGNLIVAGDKYDPMPQSMLHRVTRWRAGLHSSAAATAIRHRNST